MKKTMAAMALLMATMPALGQESTKSRHVEIQKWEELKAPKGYVLSIDLHFTKMCAKIWTQQLKEFKIQNPHIKDPNIIAINQKIKVQDCRISEESKVIPVILPVTAQETKPAAQESKLIFVVSAEMNSAEAKNDYKSQGLGVKVELGKYFSVKQNQMVKLTGGLLMNKTEASKSGPLGDLTDKSSSLLLTGDAGYLFKLNDKLHLGPNLGLLMGKNASFQSLEDKKSFAAFIGANLGYKISDKLSLDAKLSQALESQRNILSTIGLEFNF